MRPRELAQHAFPLRVNLLRRGWVIRIPYILGVILIVVAWSAAAVAAVISEWETSSGILAPTIGSTATVLLSGILLAASLLFHGMFYEGFLPTDRFRRSSPWWLVKANGAVAWLLMISVVWIAGQGFLAAASSAELFQDAIFSIWVYTARAFIVAYFGWWVLGGLCGMMSAMLSGRQMARE